MKAKKTMNRSPCQKRKLFDSLIGKVDSEIDPSYKLFLENFSKEGDTYVLDVPNGDHGKPVYVRYDEDDMTYDNVSDRNDTDFPYSSLSKGRGAPNDKLLSETSVRKAGGGKVGHSFSPWTSSMKNNTSAMDESYERFLSLVKLKDGCMVIEPEPGVTIVCEREEDMPARYDELRAGSSTNGPEPLISSMKKNTSAVDESYERFLSLVKLKDGCMVMEPEPGVTILCESEEDMPARYDELRAGSSTNGLETLISSMKKNTSAMDESYERFLSLVKIKDDCMVIEPEPDVTIVCEPEEDMHARYDELRAGSSTNGLEPLISPTANVEEYAMYASEGGLAQADKIAFEDEMGGPSSKGLDGQDAICTDERGPVLHAEHSDLNACKDDQGPQVSLCRGSTSTFDEKLNAILNQPYNQNEYEELWRKATDRKPVSRLRHLRSVTKCYVTKTNGLSYLDHYPDLALQIDSADSNERLSLLRQFFFWLENLCHEGAYMPWISKTQSCYLLSDESDTQR